MTTGTGRYVDLDHPVWIEEVGNGPATVVLLHGGLGNTDDLLGPIGGPLAEQYRVVAYDRRGHGRTADTDEPFHYDDMADEAVAVLDKVVGGPAHLVGWSDGGIVSLLVSLRRPDLVDRLVLIGTNYHIDGARELEMPPDSSLRADMRAAYGERSPDGADHFDVVRDKSIAMYGAEPTLTEAEVGQVTAPTLLVVGDDDVVELGHTASLFNALAAGQLAVVPRASHMVAMEHPAELARLVLDFLAADEPPQTMMFSRRHPR